MWFQTPRQALDRRPARTPGPGWHQGWPQGCQAILSAKARAASDPTRTKEDPSSLVHGALGAAHPRLWGPPSAHKAAAWNSTARQVRGGGQRSADSRLFSNFLGAGGGGHFYQLYFSAAPPGGSLGFSSLSLTCPGRLSWWGWSKVSPVWATPPAPAARLWDSDLPGGPHLRGAEWVAAWSQEA